MSNDIDSSMPTSTVLIVDDIPANLGVAVEHLETRGYRVVIAQEGEEGLQRAVFVQPDIILLDVLLPGQNGFEICKRLKADAKTRDIPVIFMTALLEEDSKLAGFEAGGVDYITKPLHIAELLVRVDTHLKLSLMQKQLGVQNQQLQRHRLELEQQVAERTIELSSSNRSLEAEIGVRQSAEAALQESERQYRSLVENTPDTIARYDRNCRRLYVNPKMIEEMGGEVQLILNRTPTEFPGGASAIDYEERIRKTFADAQPADFELSWTSPWGRPIVSYIRLTPEFCADGEVVSVLAVGRDITEIDEYRTSIHRLAFYDALTNLPNRALLVERMRQTFSQASGHGNGFALMLLDLDRFKNINDALGHDMGDLLLSAAAGRLQQFTRSCDMVARLGGDEFAILLPLLEADDDMAAMAEHIIKLFEEPFHISGRELFISTSIGIALYSHDSSDIDTLFRYADSAMYHAKKLGRNNFQFYISELTEYSGERMALEAALRYARANDELELYYQPQVDLATGQMIGAEALLRWNHREYGMMPPDKFIPMAEDSGLIVGIGEWVLLAACRAAVNWNSGRSIPFKIAVNLSTRQFLQNDLLVSVQRILQETQCRPEWLKLEITESLLLDDSSEILEVLNAFDAMGLALSIDDFGTGYSALSYLNRFPVSQIKIDQSFVRDIPADQDKSELVKAMIFIAQALHLDLVAEGVETREQADYLSLHGCLVAQGYLFGKPMPHAEFAAMLERSAQCSI
jgi:diguanylate cyclase (GGDEF)-like protein/PAS domain S-box-containing protein